MRVRRIRSKLAVSVTAFAVSLVAATAGMANDDGRDRDRDGDARTESPIKHVIILIGENRGTDHTFGVYRPKGKHQSISNLLSKGIVNADGSPGRNFKLARQYLVNPQSQY